MWAEAVARYKAGEPWWLETPELEALATAEQEARFARDEWELQIRQWIGIKTEVTIGAILKNALHLSNTHSGEIRVAKILKHRLGFKQVRARKGKRRYVCYQRETAVDLSPEAVDTEPAKPSKRKPPAKPRNGKRRPRSRKKH